MSNISDNNSILNMIYNSASTIPQSIQLGKDISNKNNMANEIKDIYSNTQDPNEAAMKASTIYGKYGQPDVQLKIQQDVKADTQTDLLQLQSASQLLASAYKQGSTPEQGTANMNIMLNGMKESKIFSRVYGILETSAKAGIPITLAKEKNFTIMGLADPLSGKVTINAIDASTGNIVNQVKTGLVPLGVAEGQQTLKNQKEMERIRHTNKVQEDNMNAYLDKVKSEQEALLKLDGDGFTDISQYRFNQLNKTGGVPVINRTLMGRKILKAKLTQVDTTQSNSVSGAKETISALIDSLKLVAEGRVLTQPIGQIPWVGEGLVKFIKKDSPDYNNWMSNNANIGALYQKAMFSSRASDRDALIAKGLTPQSDMWSLSAYAGVADTFVKSVANGTIKTIKSLQANGYAFNDSDINEIQKLQATANNYIAIIKSKAKNTNGILSNPNLNINKK